jgi:hypothetical protein
MVKGSSGSRDFTPAPAGTHLAVCCDVVDMGLIYSEQYGKTQHKIRVCWNINERMDDGRLFMVSKRYTASLHEKARLRQDLEAWRGSAFSSKELDGFDLEKLIGVPCYVSILHRPASNDPTKIFANVMAVMKAPKGQLMEVDPDYVRFKDRPGQQATSNLGPYSSGAPAAAEDDEIPPPTDDDVPAYEDNDSVPF